MLRKGTVHVYESVPQDDQSHRAVTVMNSLPGVMVWAGRIYPSSVGVEESAVEASHYQSHMAVSFAALQDVWEFFDATEFSGLTAQLKRRADEIKDLPDAPDAY